MARHPVGVVIPQHLLGILDRLYSADLTECRADLARGVSHILETASKRGVLRSGFTAHEMKGLYCMELRIRANHLWETSKRVIIESGVDVHPIDPIELKEALFARLDQQVLELATELGNRLSGLSLRSSDLALQKEQSQVRDRLAAEVDLFAKAVVATKPTSIVPTHPASPARGVWDRYGKEIVVGIVVTVLGGLILALVL